MWRTATLAGPPGNQGGKDGEPQILAWPEEEWMPSDMLPKAHFTSEGYRCTNSSHKTTAAFSSLSHHTLPRHFLAHHQSSSCTFNRLYGLHTMQACCMDVLATHSNQELYSTWYPKCHIVEQCENSIPPRRTKAQNL